MKKLFRQIYKSIPGKRLAFVLLRSFYVPPKWVHQHFYFKGKFKTRIENGLLFLVNHNSGLETLVFWNGIYGWETNSMKVWTYLCKNSVTILDVGANTGLYSLVAKAINPKAHVFSFEPIARISERLIENCKLNNFDIKHQNVAVSDQDGETAIYDLPFDHHRQASLIESVVARLSSNYLRGDVQTKKLATFIEEEGINRIDLMKIDVEGHEPEVLRGMGDYILTMRPNILIEIQRNEMARKIQSIVDGLGYIYFDIDEEKGLLKVSSLSESSTRNYLICTESTATGLGCLASS